MTLEEFQKKVMEIVKEFTEEHSEYDVFVSVINMDESNGCHFGSGCKGCHTEAIVQMWSNGVYPHNSKPAVKH